MFDHEVMLTPEEYEDYLIACHETEFGADCPDAALFVRDERQRFLDSRLRLLTSGAAHLDDAVAAATQLAREEARRVRALAAFARSRKIASPRRKASAIFSGGIAPLNSTCPSNAKVGTPERPPRRRDGAGLPEGPGPLAHATLGRPGRRPAATDPRATRRRRARRSLDRYGRRPRGGRMSRDAGSAPSGE